MFGGMWAVAVTDFLQMIIIVLGLLYIGYEVTNLAGGVGTVVQHANNAGLFEFFPKANFAEIIGFISALCTMMLGSIPQQDVFQRVTSSRTVQIAQRAAILGGILYFCFAFLPMILAYSAHLLTPEMVQEGLKTDSQLILPQLILSHTPLIAQIIFFGALLSAIKSCASATLLAPSVSLSENIIKGFFKELKPAQYLLIMRLTTLVFAVIVTIIAMDSKLSIFKMVESAYKVTLVAAFVPLLCGVYWKRATPMGGLLSVTFGIVSWLIAEAVMPKGIVPPQMVGLLFSFFGMFLGSVLIPADILKERSKTSETMF
jgi:Na+/proline symporter